MGYHTDFEGEFNLDERLSVAQLNYLNLFNDTRRMGRDAKIAETLGNTHKSVGLVIGENGEHFVDGLGHSGQDNDSSVIDFNNSPSTQPSLWCQWRPSEYGDSIEWDGGEKFYNYVEWLEYIIEHFIKPWGHNLNGSVIWTGEENGDCGQINVIDNVVSTKLGEMVYKEGNEFVETTPEVVTPTADVAKIKELIQDIIVDAESRLENFVIRNDSKTRNAEGWHGEAQSLFRDADAVLDNLKLILKM